MFPLTFFCMFSFRLACFVCVALYCGVNMHRVVQFLACRPVSETDILRFAHANVQLSLTSIRFKSFIKGFQICNKQKNNYFQLPNSNLESVAAVRCLHCSLDAEKSSVT